MTTNRLYGMTVHLLRLYARLMLKLDIQFCSPLTTGPKLFVANHPSASDPFLMHLLPTNHLSVLVSGNAFEMPLFGHFLHHCRQISVNSGLGKNAMEQAEKRLKEGHSVGIFPEGLVTLPEGGYHSPHSGAARLALMTGVPVVPIGIYLPLARRTYITSELSGRHTESYWYLRGPYAMTVGEPVQFDGDIENTDFVHSVTTQLMEKIHELVKASEQRVCFTPAGA
jgi:1-acyl-sn-glycerol-3-phosphate acyltransferase